MRRDLSKRLVGDGRILYFCVRRALGAAGTTLLEMRKKANSDGRVDSSWQPPSSSSSFTNSSVDGQGRLLPREASGFFAGGLQSESFPPLEGWAANSCLGAIANAVPRRTAGPGAVQSRRGLVSRRRFPPGTGRSSWMRFDCIGQNFGFAGRRGFVPARAGAQAGSGPGAVSALSSDRARRALGKRLRAGAFRQSLSGFGFWALPLRAPAALRWPGGSSGKTRPKGRSAAPAGGTMNLLGPSQVFGAQPLPTPARSSRATACHRIRSTHFAMDQHRRRWPWRETFTAALRRFLQVRPQPRISSAWRESSGGIAEDENSHAELCLVDRCECKPMLRPGSPKARCRGPRTEPSRRLNTMSRNPAEEAGHCARLPAPGRTSELAGALRTRASGDTAVGGAHP